MREIACSLRARRREASPYERASHRQISSSALGFRAARGVLGLVRCSDTSAVVLISPPWPAWRRTYYADVPPEAPPQKPATLLVIQVHMPCCHS